MTEIRFAFVGAGYWDGGDYYPGVVSVPRVPIKGEHVALPDDHGVWEVIDVTYDYSGGLHYGPEVGVVCARPSAVLATARGCGPPLIARRPRDDEGPVRN